jgi:hypothetical protein
MPCKPATVPAAVSSKKAFSHTFATVPNSWDGKAGKKANESEDLPVMFNFAFGIKGYGFINS